jgi:hypothetical protein
VEVGWVIDSGVRRATGMGADAAVWICMDAAEP